MNPIKQRHTPGRAGYRHWPRVGGCLVALVLLTAACGDGGETGAADNSTGTLLPDPIGETKIAEEPAAKTAPCRSLSAERVGALVGQPVTESRQLAAVQQQPFNQLKKSLHELCVFVPTSAPTVYGVIVMSSDEPEAYDFFTSQMKGSKGDQPVTPVPGVGDRALAGIAGLFTFSKGVRSTRINVMLGPPSLGSGSALEASVSASALELAKQLAKA